jgi:hypothetical protein
MRASGSRFLNIFSPVPRFIFRHRRQGSRRERPRVRNVDFPKAMTALDWGAMSVIRTYQAEHGGLAFDTTLTRRQRARRHRMTALAVISAMAASAGLLQHFHDNPASGGPAMSDSGAYFAAR